MLWLAALVAVVQPITASRPSTVSDLGPVPAETTRVFLIRHGQAYSNLQPEPDLPREQLDRLTDDGIAQARRAAEALRAQPVVTVICSPAIRAGQTAESIRAVLGLPKSETDVRLRPLEIGQAPGGRSLSWAERAAEWLAGRDVAPPGGESLEATGSRVAELVRERAMRYPGGALVLVAHGEVISAYLGEVNGEPPARRYPPRLDNGSISVVEWSAAAPPTLRLRGYVPD